MYSNKEFLHQGGKKKTIIMFECTNNKILKNSEYVFVALVILSILL